MAGGPSVAGNGGNFQYSTPTTGSTISQLRVEYEDAIRSLNDEKRELVMKNSAAISDMQKAEQRSWQLEEEVSRLKSELTSAHLSIQRIEMHSERDASFVASPSMHPTSFVSFFSSPGQMTKLIPEQTSRALLRRMENEQDLLAKRTPVKYLAEVTSDALKENDSSALPFLVPTPAKKTPSLIEYTQPRAYNLGENEAPECKQS